MAVNARTEEFQHIEVFDKSALFTNGRIARGTVPKGWYCYDIRADAELFLVLKQNYFSSRSYGNTYQAY